MLAVLATLVSGAPGAWDNIGIDDFAKFTLLQVTGVLQGLAFGLIFLNSAAAIVTYFVLPIAFSIVAALWEGAGGHRPLGRPRHLPAAAVRRRRTSPVRSGGRLSPAPRSGWCCPFLAGLFRVLRAELK